MPVEQARLKPGQQQTNHSLSWSLGRVLRSAACVRWLNPLLTKALQGHTSSQLEIRRGQNQKKVGQPWNEEGGSHHETPHALHCLAGRPASGKLYCR